MTSVSTLKFPEEISIANVAEWKPKLIEFVETPSPLMLDCEDLVRVDTAAIQLMTAFVLKAVSQGKTVEWEKPSPTLLQTVRLLGLNDILLIKD
jgi:anti-anti-sigma regulatory factor